MTITFPVKPLLLASLLVGFVGFDACKQDTTTTVAPTSATVSALNCGSATFSTTAVSGAAYTGTVTVPYTGGNGIAYTAGTAIASTGVTGLNATLQAGTLTSSSGNLTYSVSGTPSGAGTATFALTFGGQTCNLPLTVSSPSSGTTSGTASSTITAVMAVTTSANTSCASATGLAKIICLTEAFKATLSSTQLAATQLSYSKANAQKWSNLPASLSSRIGINLGALNATQLAAARDLLVALLALGGTNESYDEMLGNLVADDYLATAGGGSGYGAGNYYLSILGTPSATGLWSILFTGHHYTQPYTFNAGQLTGVTPAFRGVEPASVVTSGTRSYQPFEQERLAFAAMLTALSSTEQTTAKLSTTFSDLVLGPGKDAQFPATRVGLQVGTLSADKQALVLNAIKLYVNDLEPATAATILTKYTSELANTYIAYSGTTGVATQNDYVRIDGPNVWIEFSYQGGVIIRNTPHPHSVWRDRTGDYGGN
ncbi:hypothetical protein FAES_2656 [Fibrella aestuarina BUZ 2]|uniref:DUF3500 domain-containing protein n=1 Tax=Fibrella aestuarina BUZ 2 TaxID=1166018 RepID=I0K962_9BACT|nr:DUF3500 domain-containing protein [Fibrella aestuarina]CCH00665.1 hypothetical protein FAES_2656 [Fibrella aestuarina BUZ 2]